MGVPEHGGLPGRAPIVGFPDHGHSAVAPSLSSQPRHCGIDAKLLRRTHQVHAMVRASRACHGNLCEGIAVREDLVDDHLAEPTPGHLDGRRLHAGLLEIGAEFSDHRHLDPGGGHRVASTPG